MAGILKTKPMPTGFMALVLGAALTACSGGGGSDSSGPPVAPAPPPPPPPPVSTVALIDTEAEAVKFLAQAAWGGSQTEVQALQSTQAEDWIAAEFAKPASYTLQDVLALPRESNGNIPFNATTYLYWDHLITSDDELRQRMAFALSQIFVYSDIANQSKQTRRAYYQDVLIRNAFGNYRDLLEEVTYSPAMASWLTYLRNRKGDERTGRMPDENYAREILQLFSIGVVELNMDGSPRLNAQGQEIETYDNDDIVGLARVFTGLTQKGSSFYSADDDADYNRLVMYDDQHSPLEKVFLGTSIPAGTLGEDSIDRALDTIFEHPNVAPFFARQLIQRFTASNPDPAYVQRVANAFESGSFVGPNGRRFGSTGRGDLQATLAAVLLDETVFAPTSTAQGLLETGKIREPILRFMHWVRAFDVQNINSANEHRLRSTSDPVSGLGQHPFRAPSVFNYYRPGYIAPGTLSGEAELTAPELQIVNDSSAIGYFNFMTDYAFDRAGQRDNSLQTFLPDYSDELLLVEDLPALVGHLDDLLTGGRMSAEERDAIVFVLEPLPINTSTPEREQTDKLQIVQTAVALVLNSPAFAVTW